jgi:hypothetical protein
VTLNARGDSVDAPFAGGHLNIVQGLVDSVASVTLYSYQDGGCDVGIPYRIINSATGFAEQGGTSVPLGTPIFGQPMFWYWSPGLDAANGPITVTITSADLDPVISCDTSLFEA